MDIKKVWGNKKNRVIILASIFLVVLVVLAVSFTFFHGATCGNYECFKERMSLCAKADYINEEPEASWGYSVLGKSGGDCVVRVKLLQAKEGSLDIANLRGYYMDCSYPIGIAVYPEKDLSKCHGRLKEELQGIIIQKLYTYVIENIGQIGNSLKNAV